MSQVIGIILLILFIGTIYFATLFIAFSIGRKIGAKEGIDYCFDRFEEEYNINLKENK